MSYPIIICEDQLSQLQQLETIIQNYILFHSDFFKLSLKTQSPSEVKIYLKQFRPKNGIYFLDIDLNHKINGIDLAETIRKSDSQAKIIFITTHDELAPLTLKRRIEALGFVAKNQTLENYRAEITELLSIAKERIDFTKTDLKMNFTFSIGSQIFNFDLDEILFLEPSEIPHRIKLYTVNGQYEFYDTINDIEKRYHNLFRISRFCLINPLNIKEVNFSNRSICFGELSRKFSIGKAKKLKEILK
ncbi:DNA-binding response regulator [Carnobacterium maltaromaticum]|uniref:LytTR family transcriptional regulator DNA-binding domain-containing protein n=1 Tax=Carnobacterium maltaromaticum TaxID=2751 RepID=UPI000704FA0B|nr:LytTR family DNA-binding domain-containing protein [Carnobacterium maltaromaticum]KRN88150.1 response regulator [Carnobacterium maltaromaticum]MBC9810433.1 response regulator [Carnobacterium maltaromaticum]MDT1946585.1 LytTR family DNA-binding domain-containing protein [Carnobacterium maltaromaticum]MDT2000970.1 LytTR family DNA-binding domain-containing protein [Carnobacterium maltaromaticum]TFJ26235.1 DNA-binding response regulator [Carnobacterium maltaromaticum]